MRIARRDFVKSALAAVAAAALPRWVPGAADAQPKRCGMGIVEYAFAFHRKAWKQQNKADLGDPLEFLREAHRLGAGGIQTTIGDRDPDQLAKIRQFAEQNGLYVEAITSPPRDAADVPRFEKHVQAAMAVGAKVARTAIMPGRRYEQFKTLDEFNEAAKQGGRSLQLAEPILAKHRFLLAVENHKDQRLGERLDLFKRLGSEFIGACVDLGNSFTLLEDPLEVVKGLAPWAMSVHIKDQAVREYAEGFEYADVALGQGFLDLPAMVAILRKARPDVKFSFESITRNALKVPVLTDGYWATFAAVPGSDLARTLRTVRTHAAANPFPVVSRMTLDEQVAAERTMIEQSLSYARDRLGLSILGWE